MALAEPAAAPPKPAEVETKKDAPVKAEAKGEGAKPASPAPAAAAAKPAPPPPPPSPQAILEKKKAEAKVSRGSRRRRVWGHGMLDSGQAVGREAAGVLVGQEGVHACWAEQRAAYCAWVFHVGIPRMWIT